MESAWKFVSTETPPLYIR